ncbi:hypothetical protein EGW08_013701, partial [Elysia chlorotica]
CEENIVDVHGCFRRSLHEEKAVLLCVGLGLVVLHHALAGKISLVACQGYHNVGAGLSLELLHPGLGAAKCSTHRICDVVDDYCCLGPPVVHRCETVVPLLAGCVPNLKLYCRVVKTHCLCEE